MANAESYAARGTLQYLKSGELWARLGLLESSHVFPTFTCLHIRSDYAPAPTRLLYSPRRGFGIPRNDIELLAEPGGF